MAALFPAVALGAAAPASGPVIMEVSGVVQVRAAGYSNWDVIPKPPRGISMGDMVRTGGRSKAVIVFADGSRIELGPNGSFTLEEATPNSSTLKMTLGVMKAFIQKMAKRRFAVRTPTAVCSVRGTEFQVVVAANGATGVELYKGLLAVSDNRGQQTLLHPNEKVNVTVDGLGTAAPLPSQTAVQRSQFSTVMRREMSLDMSKEEVQAAAAREIKMAEYQQGKALIDIHGNRVRLEEYIVRPNPNQFKLVVLNSRESRFDYFYYLGTFNKDIPKDMSIALRQLPGGVGSEPEYYLTAFETGRSNTVDSAVEIAQGGHLVDVNNNADANDNVSYFYNPTLEKFEDVSGLSVYQTLFDKYGFYINGRLKYGWTGNNITAYSGATQSSNTDPITGAALSAALPARSLSVAFPDADAIHQVIHESYSDGTFIKWDNYIINNEGKVATYADFGASTSGSSFKERILNFNYEQILTASEFNGRKIDLVVEPKIFVQAGLIQ